MLIYRTAMFDWLYLMMCYVLLFVDCLLSSHVLKTGDGTVISQVINHLGKQRDQTRISRCNGSSGVPPISGNSFNEHT